MAVTDPAIVALVAVNDPSLATVNAALVPVLLDAPANIAISAALAASTSATNLEPPEL